MRETGEKGRGWGDGTIMDERRSAGGDPSEEQGGGATGEIRQRRGSAKGRRQERCGPAGSNARWASKVVWVGWILGQGGRKEKEKNACDGLGQIDSRVEMDKRIGKLLKLILN
jgi:hypothetical protein